jgi:hypothetical protein
MKHILIILSLILLSSPLFGQSDADDEEYRYKITSGFLWKTIGKEKIKPKYQGYVGSYKNGVPFGQGTMNYYDGGKMVGEFRKYAWNTTLYDKNGLIVGTFVEGKYRKQ